MAVADVVINFLGDASGLRNELNQASSGMDKFKARVNIAAIGIAGSAVAIGTNAVKIASDTSESASKVQTLFGQSAKSINDFAANAANAYGMSKQEALETVGAMGAVQIAMGVQADQAAKLSVEYTKLAVDLGSFNNASSEEVSEALTNSLSGEYEMLKKYGIVVNDVTLSQEAQRIGMKKTGATWDSAQKQQLSYNIIMASTKKAQGDFARTSDGMANQTKKLQATVVNLQGSLGEKLLPIVVKVMSAMNDAFGWMERHQTTTKILAWTIGILGGAIVTLAVGMKVMALATALNSAAWGALATVMWANPVFLIAGVILGIAAALFIAYKKVDWFRAAVDTAFRAIKAVVSSVVGFISEHWSTIFKIMTGPIGLAVRIVSSNFGRIKGFAQDAKDAVVRIFQGIGNAISAPFKAAFDAVRWAWNSTLGGKGFDFPGFDPPGPGSIPGMSFRIPALADGGIAQARRAHWVGERGPEVFVPGRTGTVIPNHALGGGGGPDTLALTLDLGHGIREVVEIKLRDHDRGLKRADSARSRRSR